MIYDHKKSQFETIKRFDTILYALDGNHGLAIHNRKFFYDNYSKSLQPIYYDIDSQIVSRNLTFPKCSELLQYDYQLTSCINNFSKTAQNILSEINFDSNTIYENLRNKNIKVEFEIVDLVFNKFLSNLKDISLMDSNSFNLNDNFKENFQNNYLNFIKTPIVHFYFTDLENEEIRLCDSYLDICTLSSFFNERLENDLVIDGITYHLVEFDYIINNQFTTYYLKDDVYLKDFGSSKIKIDKINKTLHIDVLDSKRFLITGEGYLKDWTINFNGNLNNEISSIRQDDNSLTGCLTIHNIEIIDLNIMSKNNNCEDAVNLLNVSGSIKLVEIKDSYFDALDIDFSNIEIETIEVLNSGNDCLDISFSNINNRI